MTRRSFYGCWIAVLLLAAGSCHKGVALEDAIGINTYFYNCTVDPVSLRVIVNNEVMAPLLTSGNNWAGSFELPPGTKGMQVKITQLPQEASLADLYYVPAAGVKAINYFTIYQARSGDVPYLLLPTDTAGLSKEKTWLRFTYSQSNMPDSLLMKLYYSTNATVVQDSCLIRRFEFSNWGGVALSADYTLQYEVYNAQTGARLIAKKNFFINRQYLSLDYNIYRLQTDQNGEFSATRLY